MENKMSILGVEYEIVSPEELNAGEEQIGGFHDGFERKLFVAQHEVKEFMRTCLLHEALHAMFFEAGFENYSDDEKLISALEHLLPKVSGEFKRHNLI